MARAPADSLVVFEGDDHTLDGLVCLGQFFLHVTHVAQNLTDDDVAAPPRLSSTTSSRLRSLLIARISTGRCRLVLLADCLAVFLVVSYSLAEFGLLPVPDEKIFQCRSMAKALASATCEGNESGLGGWPEGPIILLDFRLITGPRQVDHRSQRAGRIFAALCSCRPGRTPRRTSGPDGDGQDLTGGVVVRAVTSPTW